MTKFDIAAHSMSDLIVRESMDPYSHRSDSHEGSIAFRIFAVAMCGGAVRLCRIVRLGAQTYSLTRRHTHIEGRTTNPLCVHLVKFFHIELSLALKEPLHQAHGKFRVIGNLSWSYVPRPTTGHAHSPIELILCECIYLELEIFT